MNKINVLESWKVNESVLNLSHTVFFLSLLFYATSLEAGGGGCDDEQEYEMKTMYKWLDSRWLANLHEIESSM